MCLFKIVIQEAIPSQQPWTDEEKRHCHKEYGNPPDSDYPLAAQIEIEKSKP